MARPWSRRRRQPCACGRVELTVEVPASSAGKSVYLVRTTLHTLALAGIFAGPGGLDLLGHGSLLRVVVRQAVNDA